MVRLQISIPEFLHHHTLSNMMFNEIPKAHCVQIVSCSGPRANTWLTIRQASPTFRLFSLIFFMALQTWFGLPHPSISNIFQCVCMHPINPMGIHFLHALIATNARETHDPICNTFATIAWNAGFHVRW
jgi:hypothetical protein